ncbi:hypothetical protein HGRIS_014795 [Hohenbuehelia grisea]|uniref:Uncharacterized protein n=1 Tax=Hohenbuehelia grisea TaxID=104357 RepID=A0ABR3IQW7_9AGAR
MPISATQKAAIEQVIQSLLTATPPGPRGKRHLAGMFLELVDRHDWAHYYEVIPEPRCLNNIRAGVTKGRYKDPLDVYTDLCLVFWNALYYNEAESQIAVDAETLKSVLENGWKKHSVLPLPRSFSPPPSSAQKVHATAPEATPTPTSAPVTQAPATKPPAKTPVKTKVSPAVRTSTPILMLSQGFNHKPAAPPAAQAQTSTAAQSSADADMDVDIDGGSDDDGADSDAQPGRKRVRDKDGEGEWRDSEGIVRQLENGLPKWPGYSEDGWMPQGVPADRFSELVHGVKSYKDVIGNRVATALEAVPEDSGAVPYLSYSNPLSLKLIESRARHKSYQSAKDFDMDMMRLFEKARRYHEPGSEAYGKVLLLQRLYQSLTSTSPPHGPPYSSTSNFAALSAGPASPSLADETTMVQGVPPTLRAAVLEVRYKGLSIRVGDWVHLANPDDTSRPIIGQVFGCWVSQDVATMGKEGVNVCWYYRPEQTFHQGSKTFMEHEIFKTVRHVDHPQEDIIEKVACQPLALFARGRPRSPHWYPGFPLYVCSNRYRERERSFLRIRNWDAIPPTINGTAEGKPVMTSLHAPIYEFERKVTPRRISSPFVAVRDGKGKAVSTLPGPGGLLDEGAAGTNGVAAETPVGSRKRVSRRPEAPDGTSKAASPAPAALGATLAGYQYQGTTLSQQQLLALSAQAQTLSQSQRPDRSVVTAAGGIAAGAQVEPLPAETVKHFDRDPETNEVLWFAAPPLDIARLPSAPKHSLAYLHFLAMKRKKGGDNMEVDDQAGNGNSSAKRLKTLASPTVGEAMAAALQKAIAS